MVISICEDEEKVRSYISSSFKLDGYSVIETSSLSELIDTLSINKEIKLLILDRLIGNTDSSKYLKDILNIAPHIKILVLSAIDTPEQKAQVLDLGAHDYLSKPFRLIELQARVRALLRNSHEISSPKPDLILELKNMKIDKLRHKVFINQKVIELSNKEYQLLLQLSEHPGRVYNRYQLLDIIWNSQHDVESNVVEVTIKNLRKKLTQANSEVTIESRRQVGYWIEE
jgi:DNA-binding response OmpR family regulator